MPRLSTQLIQQAWRISPLAALLLRSCRDIPSTKNELRWISEHVSQIYSHHNHYKSSPSLPRSLGYHEKLALYRLCKSRSRGVPLQYILGTQPFGDLEIKCRKGVLIPRFETEAYTLEISRILLDEIRGTSTPNTKNAIKTAQNHQQEQDSQKTKRKPRPVRILDICSGTGCISLQLYSQLRHACPNLEVIGLDISQKAVDLSRENIRYNKLLPTAQEQHQQKKIGSDDESHRHCQSISYHRANIFSPSSCGYIDRENLGLPSPDKLPPPPELSTRNEDSQTEELELKEWEWDLVISNPPYISAGSFSRNTTRSVRNFEPKLALVPDDDLVGIGTVSNVTKGPDNTDLVSACQAEDIFYARILDLFLPRQSRPRTRARRILFEVADMQQACRVVGMMTTGSITSRRSPCLEDMDMDAEDTNNTIEIWRDDPSSSSLSTYYHTEDEDMETPKKGGHQEEEEKSVVVINGRKIPIRGSGNVRSVYFFAGDGQEGGFRGENHT